ncbi:MAG: DUF4435 domain-containing protein [Bacteroidales bacterium]|jgi:hypothetical protein|nr:DUF4435 domain-containing protein [Bacteroidales bacterium]
METDRRDTYYRQLALDFRNKAKINRCVAAVHLESDFDKVFWNGIFKHFVPEYAFDYVTYSRTIDNNRATGCSACLKYHRLGCLSDEFFVCIDSDYRYLLREEGIDVRHFIFQTYTYSLENHYCYPQNIAHAADKMGWNSRLFDFESFLKKYSQTLYELFIYHLISLSRNDGKFPPNVFRKYLNIDPVTPDARRMIAKLQSRVKSKLMDLKHLYPDVDLYEVKEHYRQAGLNEHNGYLYFRGHNVFEQVVLRIVRLIAGREKNRAARHGDGAKEPVAGIRKSPVKYLLEDIHFDQYPEINKIKRDVKTFFQNN